MATLTFGIKESVTIGGTTHSFDTTGTADDYEITGVNHVFQQTLDVLSASATQVIKFDNSGSPTESAGQIKAADFKYMRITNNDGGNFVVLSLQDATLNYAKNFKLLPGQSMIFKSLLFETTDSSVTLGTQFANTIRATAEEVIMRADTADCSCSIFVAYA